MIKKRSPMAMLTIGELADCAETNAVTIRYYEKRHLISTSERSEGGHRLYSETLVHRLRFIQNAKSVGFSLEEILVLLELQQHKNHSSHPIKKMTLDKIQIIDEKITALQDIKHLLEKLSCQCDGTAIIQDCPILVALQSESLTTENDIAQVKNNKLMRKKRSNDAK